MTFEEMLSRCEEQTESAHDSTKIKFEMWDVTMRHAAHHMEPNMDCDDETPRTCQEANNDEEQVRRSHGTNMSTSQVDPKFQTHMASHAPPEMKVRDCKGDYKVGVLINQEIDDQPSRGKRKRDEEDDRKPAVKPKKHVPEDDQESHDDQHSHDQETIKKKYIEEMFQRHFKTMLGPQDDSEEPSIHPTVAHMDAVRTINVLQAMLHHQHQLLDLYNAKAHQDACYTPISEQKWSKPKTYGDIQGEAKVDKKRMTKIIQHMLKVPEETSYQERIWICR